MQAPDTGMPSAEKHGKNHISIEELSSLASSCPVLHLSKTLAKVGQVRPVLLPGTAQTHSCLGLCSIHSEHFQELAWVRQVMISGSCASPRTSFPSAARCAMRACSASLGA